MHFVASYLDKQHFHPAVEEKPADGLSLCVVVPVCNEPDVLTTLESLWKCNRPVAPAEVLLVVNAPENASASVITQNQTTLQQCRQWIDNHNDPSLRFYIINRCYLPEKDAGVGMARKIGMDEASCRLMHSNQQKGIICGFDADSTCDPNYLCEVETYFRQHPKTDGASIYFEHPLHSGPNLQNKGIATYELHLRYMNQALRFTGFPFAYHTVGSSMAVTLDSYVKQGGMNKRKAGEDFYFLQKIIELGHFGEINTTRVIPSARISGRVPFGTGAAMKQWEHDQEFLTYSFEAYQALREFLICAPDFYREKSEILYGKFAVPLQEYLSSIDFNRELDSIRSNCASEASFQKRFFRWFNAFKIIKYLNFSHKSGFSKVPVTGEAEKLLWQQHLISQSLPIHLYEMLQSYRQLDRSGFGLTCLQSQKYPHHPSS